MLGFNIHIHVNNLFLRQIIIINFIVDLNIEHVLGLWLFQVLNILEILFLKIVFVDYIDEIFKELRLRYSVALQEQFQILSHLLVLNFIYPHRFFFFLVVPGHNFILNQVFLHKLLSKLIIFPNNFTTLQLEILLIFLF